MFFEGIEKTAMGWFGGMNAASKAAIKANVAASKAARTASTAAQAAPTVTGTTRGFRAGKEMATTLPNNKAARLERNLDTRKKGVTPVPVEKPRHVVQRENQMKAEKAKTQKVPSAGDKPEGSDGFKPHWGHAAAAGALGGYMLGSSRNE